jgi:hypothetical protein
LEAGQVLIEHCRFALTSNNITYARLGDSFQYWQYFPGPLSWGRVPVWGIGRVLYSRHSALVEGEQIFGFFPMSTHLLVQPDPVSTVGFIDASAHRASLVRTYNEYVRIDSDPFYDKAIADLHLVLKPLFSLSFFLAEFLSESDCFGARVIIISSASSKVALGLVAQLRRVYKQNIQFIGLTAESNVPFVERTAPYDLVLSYDQIDELPNGTPTMYVDIAGVDRVRDKVHMKLLRDLQYSCRAGLSHGTTLSSPPDNLPGPTPEFFFTPQHMLERRETWGVELLNQRYTEALQSYARDVAGWLRIEHRSGRGVIEHSYLDVLEGRHSPDRADILSFGENK